jgi:hypothetical protein
MQPFQCRLRDYSTLSADSYCSIFYPLASAKRDKTARSIPFTHTHWQPFEKTYNIAVLMAGHFAEGF